MSEVNEVRFFSKYKSYRIYVPDGYSASYIVFKDFELTTSDPFVISTLLAHQAEKPWEVWIDPEQGREICPVCFKVCKDAFGLKGHMTSHEKDKSDVEEPEE